MASPPDAMPLPMSQHHDHSMSAVPWRRRLPIQAGFTLVELLIVVGDRQLRFAVCLPQDAGLEGGEGARQLSRAGLAAA